MHRPAITGFERYFGSLAIIGTKRGKHFSWDLKAIATVAVPISVWLSCLTVFGTAFRPISRPLGLVELLMFGAMRESNSAIGTTKRFALKTYWMTSNHFNVSKSLVIQYCRGLN